MLPLTRCLIGVPLPSHLVEQLLSVQKTLRRAPGGDGIRWTPESMLVLKLVNLGEVTAGALSKISNSLQEICAGYRPIALNLDQIYGQPNNVQPREILVRPGGETDIIHRLAGDCYQKCSPSTSLLGEGTEPHIELGRLKTFTEKARTDAGRGFKNHALISSEPWSVDRITILEHASGDSGPYLKELMSFPLGADPQVG